MLFDIGFTIFGVVWIAWLIIDLFTQKDKSLKEDKIKLIDKYNDFGYYPQYESIVSEIRADKYCAYYDENLECFRCPVDDAFVGHSADTKKCIQNGYINECETCVKNKLMHTYNEVVD